MGINQEGDEEDKEEGDNNVDCHNEIENKLKTINDIY